MANEKMNSQYYGNTRPVYIVDSQRTPFLKARGEPGPFSAADLAVNASSPLFVKHNLAPRLIEQTILGCVIPGPDEANIARIVSLRLGIDKSAPAWTVQRNCASAMQAIDSATKDIAQGRHDLVLAGGTEAMSHAPILWNQQMTAWFGRWFKAKSWTQKLRLLTQLRPSYLKPVIGLLHGLTDPIVNLNTGQTAENLAYQFDISRKAMDEFAVNSHHQLAEAIDQGLMDEICPIFDHKGYCYQTDTGLRGDTDVSQLAKLKPYFDKPFGLVTAGNSSQVTDGAAMVLLASEDAVKRYQLPYEGVIRDVHWAGTEPEVMGLGPVMASTPILQRQGMTVADIDYWEINEAFACQVLACLQAWQDDTFCREQLNLSQALGPLNRSKLNIDGGAVALGHPVGASGARIVMHLLRVLNRKQAKRGIATLCIGGGQGGAMLLEVPDKEGSL